MKNSKLSKEIQTLDNIKNKEDNSYPLDIHAYRWDVKLLNDYFSGADTTTYDGAIQYYTFFNPANATIQVVTDTETRGVNEDT